MKRYLQLIAGYMVVIGMTSCQKDANMPQKLAVSYLMIYNGGANYFGASSMVLVNNQFYGSRSYNDNGAGLVGAFNFSRYSRIDTGLYRIAFTDTAQAPENAKKVTESLFDLQDDRHYTIYLLDSLGFYGSMYTKDDVDKDPVNAKIRLINLSPDAGAVYCKIDTMSVGGIEDISYRQVSGYSPVRPDTKPGIRIMYRDKNTGMEQQLVRKSFVLEAGKCYTMILRGYKSPADGNVNKTINLSTITNF